MLKWHLQTIRMRGTAAAEFLSPTKYIILIKKNTRPQEMFQEDRERAGSNEAEGYRGLTQHGGPPVWLEEELDPAGVIFVQAVPPAVSVLYRLPSQELPS
jgi:hypothetical protein